MGSVGTIVVVVVVVVVNSWSNEIGIPRSDDDDDDDDDDGVGGIRRVRMAAEWYGNNGTGRTAELLLLLLLYALTFEGYKVALVVVVVILPRGGIVIGESVNPKHSCGYTDNRCGRGGEMTFWWRN
jgi:hypothetical protein